MNNIRVITFKLLRTYSTKSTRPEFSGIRGKITLTETNDLKDVFEEFDQEDVEAYEPHLMEVTKSHVNYKREALKAKEQLRQRIVRSKVFNEVDPSFLTFAEKDQVRKLHESNPEEWTPEKLSESFPALPENIQKVLKAKWVPTSVDSIIRYEKRVIENWKQLKTGKLALNPMLREHLMKFGDRKINLTDRKTLAKKFIPPKIKFPSPKSSFFRSIVNDSINKKPVAKDRLLISSQNDTNTDERDVSTEKKKDVAIVKKDSASREIGKVKVQEKLVFDEFLKSKLNSINEISSEERIVLMDTYKKHVESKNLEDVNSHILNDIENDITVKEESISTLNNLINKDALAVRKYEVKSKVSTEMNNQDASLDTYVVERKSYIDNDFAYTHSIKIPKNMYQKGKIYRIKDCYYDDDGEFLYRVPGLRS